MMGVEEFEKQLLALDPEAIDFLRRVDDLVADSADEHGAKLVPSIFRFFSAKPLADVGLPGTLVHFTEQFYPIYKQLLLESLKNSPSVTTVLMANRILNSNIPASERSEYLDALNSAASHSLASPAVRTQARHFIAYQHGRG